ncbi:MAG: hypothetical protein IKP95_00805 [Ruminococcus sp.]|nr:hypothetical protein [Ruminococcus sp.]
MIVLIIIGIALVALGVYLCVFQRAKSANVALEIQAQPTKTYEEIKEALEAMQDYDPNYRELVEFKGIASTNGNVVTPYSNTRVAFYVAENYQVSENSEEYRDANGNKRIRTNRSEQKMGEEVSNAELLVKDPAGNEIVIETKGIENKLELDKSYDVLDRSNTGNPAPARSFGFGGVRANGTGHRIIGYKLIEKTFALNTALYVLGEAYMMSNRIYIGPPKNGKDPFIVTSKSEEQLLKSKKSSQTTSLVGGLGLALLGLVLFIVGIAKK